MSQYRLLDSGNMRKLEQVGRYRLIRPALTAFWSPALHREEWENCDAIFTRDSSGGGKWSFRRQLPESWQIQWGGLNLLVKLTGFGHLGFFAEQYRNWEEFRNFDSQGVALNLFAYSGLGSLSMAQSGMKVCHLDAARGMVEWGKENLELNPQIPDNIRWIVDDVSKFMNREVRRKSRYRLIALDPPTFGRGAAGQLWKIENDLPGLLRLCRELRDPEFPFTVYLSCHSPGFSYLVLERLLYEAFGGKGEISGGEMTIPESTGRLLPSGFSVRCQLP